MMCFNSDEARKESEGNPYSLYHITRPEIDFPVGTDEHDERVYAKAVENYKQFRKNGLVQMKPRNTMYILKLGTKERNTDWWFVRR